MSTTQRETTEALVENFIATMRFIAANDLWDESQRALDAAEIRTIECSTDVVRTFRQLLSDDLLPNDRLLDERGRRNAQIVVECGCGVSNPGPGGRVEFPRTETDAGDGGGG